MEDDVGASLESPPAAIADAPLVAVLTSDPSFTGGDRVDSDHSLRARRSAARAGEIALFWSLRFKDPQRELNFLQFNTPGRYTLITVLLLILCATAVQLTASPAHGRSEVLRAGTVVVVVALLALDVSIICLQRAGRATELTVAKIRQVESIAILIIALVLTIDQRADLAECWAPGRPQQCLRFLDPGQFSFISLCFVASVDFTILGPLLFCPFTAELLIALLLDPPELTKPNRYARLLYVWCVSAFSLVYLYTYESWSRQRFLVVDSLRALREEATKHHQKASNVLRSVCPPDALEAFLQQRLVRNDAELCSILVLRASDFVAWRQQFTVDEAFNWIDVVHEAWEKRRRAYNVERISVRGDTSIFSSGFRCVDQGAPHNTESIVLFALRQLSYFDRPSDAKVPFRLRGAIATGPCSGVMLPGAPVAYLASGLAFSEAVRESRRAPAGQLIISPETAGCLLTADREAILGSSQLASNSRPRVLSTTVAFSTESSFLAPAEVVRRNSESGLEWRVPAGVNEEMQRAERLTATAKRMEEKREQSLGLSFKLFPARELPGYSAFLVHQAWSQRNQVTALWITASFTLGAIMAWEDSVTTATGTLLLVGAAVGCCRAFTRQAPSLPWLLWGSGVIQVMLLLSAVRCSRGSILEGCALSLYLLAAMPVLEAAALGSAIPGLISVAVIQSVLGALTFVGVPSRSRNDLVYLASFWILTAILATVWLLDRQVTFLRRFLETESHETWLELQQVETELHRRVLDCLLPEYIVSHVLQKQSCEWSAVADLIPDLAGLYVRTPLLSIDMGLTASAVFDSVAVVTSGSAHVVFRDGDTCIVAGPLRRQRPLAASIHLSSALLPPRLPLETRSTVTVEEVVAGLAAVLSSLRLIVPLASAVLHRGDGAAVVFGSTLPTFAVEGPISEVGLGLLDMIDEGDAIVTTAAYCDSSAFPSDLIVGSEAVCRLRAAGQIRYHHVFAVDKPLGIEPREGCLQVA